MRRSAWTAVVGGSMKRRAARVRAASSQSDARVMRSQRVKERRVSFRRGDAVGGDLWGVLGMVARLQHIARCGDARFLLGQCLWGRRMMGG
jgi:hypothetical protein